MSGAATGRARADSWSPARAIELAQSLIRGAAEDDAWGRVLKVNEHGSVVWLARGGPRGEAVVVKSRHPNSAWSRHRDRWARSPAVRQREIALACADAGVDVPEVLAVDDQGWPAAACHVVTRAVLGAEPLLSCLQELDRPARRALARALGRFVATLHDAGIYVPDLKHDNLLVWGGGGGAPRIVLVDLDRARRPHRGVSRRRRVRNLVQLHWRLSWESSPRERFLVLGHYARALGATREARAALVADVDRAWRRKQQGLMSMRRRTGLRPGERPGLSAMIICQNEVRRILACLESVAWCDEIVVVDGGSSDGTLELCRNFGARVFENPWPGHRAQKQFALEHTSMPWVLNVDADERVPADLREEIEWLLAHDGAGKDGFQVPRLVRYLGRWWWRGGWYPSRRLRLFRREKTVWGGVDPHEKAVVNGPTGRIHAPLWHLSYENVAHHLRSIDRLTDTAARARPRRARWDRLYLRPPARFLRSWLAGRGFLEGLPGLFVALASALYVHVKYVKADEEAARGGSEDS